MFLLQRKYRPLLGLDITTSSVKLIELVMGGGQYRVEAYAAEPTPQNAINEKAIVDAEAVGEAAHQIATAAQPERARRLRKGAERVRQTVGATEHAVPEPVEDAPRQDVASAEEQSRDNPTEDLPLHKWVQAASQPDYASAAADWPHALLRRDSDKG